MKSIIKKITVVLLTLEARMVIAKYKPRIVAITGSVGKTSTRDAVYTVLSAKFFVRKSEKSLSNELIVPLTILGESYGGNNPFVWFKTVVEGLLMIIFPYAYPAWLVLEMGAERPGSIRNIAKWLKPDVAVITSFGFGNTPVHVEFFRSIDDLVLEKAAVARSLKPDGLLVFNHDDEKVQQLAETVPQRKISYGFGSGSDVQSLQADVMYGLYENSEIEFPLGMEFKAEAKTEAGSTGSFGLELVGALGRQHVLALLAGAAVGLGLESSLQHESSAQQEHDPRRECLLDIATALKNHIPPRGRMRLLPGIRDTLIIDDSYNSSPVAVSAALETLRGIKTAGRKIAIMGDMLELGRYSIAAHRKMGEEVADSADILVTVGIRSRGAAEAALDKGLADSAVLQFDSSVEAGRYIADNVLKPGDIVLVKGSQAERMERCVEAIMEHSEDKEELLVRQDKYWLKRR